jgi:hypothetical protein
MKGNERRLQVNQEAKHLTNRGTQRVFMQRPKNLETDVFVCDFRVIFSPWVEHISGRCSKCNFTIFKGKANCVGESMYVVVQKFKKQLKANVDD